MRIWLSIFFFILIYSTSKCQERYFYTGKDYGSESAYNPVYLILNGSYDVIQLEGSSRRFLKFPYAKGAANVFKNLMNPLGTVSNFGWNKFLSNEVFPLVFVKKGGQWLPNYQLHLIGGGMTYASLQEWFRYHNYPLPTLFSLTTVASYHLLNEAVENWDYKGETVDPIADIYIFDIAGIVLFSFDNVKRFFRNELNLSDWSLQPSVSISDLSLQNNGQYFSMKWKIPYLNNLHLFYYFGMSGLLGLSYKFDNGSAISSGAGLRARRRYIIDNNTNQMTVDMDWDLGVFYDRNNSLLASLTMGRHVDNAINLNIYPGIIKLYKFSPGLWITYKKNHTVCLGFSTTYGTGLGF